MRVISASRRTDIPAFYTPWLLRRLDEGFSHVVNPRSGNVAGVSLAASDVLAIGLFTRDPRRLVPHLPGLLDRGYRLYAHMTVNGYPDALEPRSPDADIAIDAFKRLSEAVGPPFAIWRYDPIILGGEFDAEYHVRRFSCLAAAMEGSCEQAVISFVDPYAKTRRNLAGETRWEMTEEHVGLASTLREVALAHGIDVRSCAEPLAAAGIRAGACVDPELIARLRPDVPVRLRLASTRAGCLCHQAIDIGTYHTCAFGCTYCYATETPQVGLDNRLLHDPSDTLLLRPESLRGVDLVRVPEQNRKPAQSQLGLF